MEARTFFALALVALAWLAAWFLLFGAWVGTFTLAAGVLLYVIALGFPHVVKNAFKRVSANWRTLAVALPTAFVLELAFFPAYGVLDAPLPNAVDLLARVAFYVAWFWAWHHFLSRYRFHEAELLVIAGAAGLVVEALGRFAAQPAHVQLFAFPFFALFYGAPLVLAATGVRGKHRHHARALALLAPLVAGLVTYIAVYLAAFWL